MRIAFALSALLLPVAGIVAPGASSAQANDMDPHKTDPVDAIECRLDAPGYNGFALSVSGDDGIAAERHWTAIKSSNPFLSEYDLPTPIVVAGRYSTRRIAFSASAIMAVLDLPDPAVLAGAEKIENAANPDPMIDAIVSSGTATRAQVEADLPFRKFLGERVISDKTEPMTGQEWRAHEVIARTVSNVTTHPGKTLYGCSYKIELLGKDGRPL